MNANYDYTNPPEMNNITLNNVTLNNVQINNGTANGLVITGADIVSVDPIDLTNGVVINGNFVYVEEIEELFTLKDKLKQIYPELFV